MRLLGYLTFRELREANRTRCENTFHPIDAWSPTDWACAMAGEVGEACNEVKKLRRLDGADASEEKRDELVQKIGHELADTVIYADLLAERLGIDLGDAVREKFNIVSESRGSSIRL
jgi:NTP pyrophosphatase (non-canonical NTP hydrolase)